MTRVLVTGDNSYVGRSLAKHVKGRYSVDEISLKGAIWKDFNFSEYDAVIHVAAIVHQPELKDDSIYYRINRDLAVEVAQKAFQQGIKHFIFFSTMAVYGVSPSLTGGGCIETDTPCNPINAYGKSKFEAEQALGDLEKHYPAVLSIIRPPMIYGPDCPGKYFHRLAWMARCLPAFPTGPRNHMGMISIHNLCELLRLIIENQLGGIYCPQDISFTSTEERLQVLAKHYNHRLCLSKKMGDVVLQFRSLVPVRQIDSLYGNLYYNPKSFHYFNNRYIISSFEATVG